MSILTGKFLVRMSINVVFFFVTAIFMTSLLRIKHQISAIDSKKVLKVNYALMNMNLVTYAGQTCVYATVFALSFFDTSGETPGSCRVALAFDVFYWFIWVSLLSRTSMTSYMNIKFS